MAKTIKIYSTGWCVYCKAEKEFLDSKNIAYESIMVDEDEKLADELMELSGGMSVPFTLIIDGEGDDAKTEKILGFDRPRIAAALGI